MTVLGVDVSKWQGKMNWQKCYDNGARFAYIRAGSVDNVTGKCYTDNRFWENAASAPSILPVGYYWYFRPNWSVKDQAEYFCNLLKQVSYKLAPCGDIEADPSTWGKKITPGDYADLITRYFMYIMEMLKISRCRVYTRQSVWDYQVAARPFWSTLETWFARYNPDLFSPWSDGKFKFRDFKDWKFWQFSSTGDGYAFGTDVGSKGIDLNYFNGSLEDLYAYIGGWTEDPKTVWMQKIDQWARSQGYTGPTPNGG